MECERFLACVYSNTVTIGDLPARFDWSIIGWTILLLALMNLRRMKEAEGQKRGREEVKEDGGKKKYVSVFLKTRSGKNR